MICGIIRYRSQSEINTIRPDKNEGFDLKPPAFCSRATKFSMRRNSIGKKLTKSLTPADNLALCDNAATNQQNSNTELELRHHGRAAGGWNGN
jgi:hypothetical protein